MDRSTREAQLRSLGLTDDQVTAALEAIENPGSSGRYFKPKEDAPFEVIGTVTSRWTTPGHKNVGIDPGVGIKHEGIPELNEEAGILNVCNGYTAWRNAVGNENPQPGDVVSFHFTGLQPSKKPNGADYWGIEFKLLARNAVSDTGGEKAPF